MYVCVCVCACLSRWFLRCADAFLLLALEQQDPTLLTMNGDDEMDDQITIPSGMSTVVHRRQFLACVCVFSL